MIRALLLLLALASLAPARAAPENTTILVLGDSLSAAHGIDRNRGWVTLLQARLERRGISARVVNASIGGDTTRGGLARLPRALDEHHPDVLVIELGGNDGLRGVPLDETERNLTRMIELARRRDVRVLLVGVRLPTNYGRGFIERFQNMYHDVARKENVPLVAKLLQGVGGDPALMQNDGIHPNAEAQPKLLDNVWPALEPMLPAGSG